MRGGGGSGEFPALLQSVPGEATPDDTALCRFRTVLGQAELAEALMAEINRRLDVGGPMLRRARSLMRR